MTELHLQFAFSEDGAERLEKMRKQLDTTYTEVVRNAIRLYEWYLAQTDDIGLVRNGELIKVVDITF